MGTSRLISRAVIGVALSTLIMIFLIPSVNRPVGATPSQESISIYKHDFGLSTFAVIGDLHIPNNKHVQKIIEGLNRSGVDRVFILGDSITGGDPKRQWALFDEALSTLRVPYIHVRGNHDTEGGVMAERYYKQKFGERTYWSFVDGGTHFIILDTETHGPEREKMLAWLESEVSKECDRRFVFCHRPILDPIGNGDGDLVAILYDKADLIFSGHRHCFTIKERGEIVQVISGGGGFSFHKMKNSKQLIHFLVCSGNLISLHPIKPGG